MQIDIKPDANDINDILNDVEAQKRRKFFFGAFAAAAGLAGIVVAVKLINDIEIPEEQ